jgi:tetratricopeptide (TPR) repeat protein
LAILPKIFTFLSQKSWKFNSKYSNMAFKDTERNDLIRKFEGMLRNKENISLAEDAYEDIIAFYSEKGKFRDALKACNFALKQYPFSYEFKLEKAQLLLHIGNYDQALSLIESVEVLQPFDLDTALLKSNALCFVGKFDEAIEALHNILPFHEQSSDEIYFSLGLVYQNWGKLEEAIECFKETILRNINHESATFELTYALESLQKLSEGITFYEKIIDEDPYNHLAWYYMGEIYDRMRKPEEALHAFEYATLIKDDFSDAYFGLGVAYMNLGEYLRAREAFLKVMDIDQDEEPDTLCHLAATYEKSGNYHQAIEYYRKAIRADAQWDEAWYGVGTCLYAQEKWFEALSVLKRATELNPDNPTYWLALANTEYEFGNLFSALEAYQNASELDPFNATIWLNWSVVYYEQGDYQKALATIEEGLEEMPDEPTLIYHQIAYLMSLGNFKEAFNRLEIALALHYDQHILLYEFFEDLEIQKALFKIIQQYKPQ